MSIWNSLKNIALQPINGLKSIAGIPSGHEKRQQQRELNAQVKAYQEQTEITKKELAAKKDQELSEKRRVEEKQIRALRRSSRAQGFLGTSAQTLEPGQSAKLGG